MSVPALPEALADVVSQTMHQITRDVLLKNKLVWEQQKKKKWKWKIRSASPNPNPIESWSRSIIYWVMDAILPSRLYEDLSTNSFAENWAEIDSLQQETSELKKQFVTGVKTW